MRVRVCDDLQDMADGWVDEIREALPRADDIQRMADAKDEVSKLLQRKLDLEAGKAPFATGTSFDDVDVLVVDYDLLHLDETGSRTTGEGVARLARCLSSCGVIVVMNQFKGPQFDLGMRGHLQSFADLNIAASLAGTPALWDAGALPSGEFAPTTWTPVPTLLQAARDLTKRLSESGLDAPLLAQIGLNDGALERISDTAYGFVSSEAATAADLAAISVNTFLYGAMDKEHVEQLANTTDEQVFRLAAHRVIKWLDRAVLRPMDVLIDVPHLIDRLPFVIDENKSDLSDPAAWTAASVDPAALLKQELLEPFRNEGASHALGRTVYDWYRIANDEAFDDLQEAYIDAGSERFVLAEDTSRFVRQQDATRYRADFHNFSDRRTVERLPTISYGPARRLTFG